LGIAESSPELFDLITSRCAAACSRARCHPETFLSRLNRKRPASDVSAAGPAKPDVMQLLPAMKRKPRVIALCDIGGVWR